MTIAGLLSLCSPRAKRTDLCEIYPICMPITEFELTKNIKVTIPFNEESLMYISKYEKCILYFTLLLGRYQGRTTRWFQQHAYEYIIKNDAGGKFEKGVQQGLKDK